MRYIFQIKENGTVLKVPVKGIDVGLDELQKAVGGYIEVVHTYLPNVVIICDEEGKYKGYGENSIATMLLPGKGTDYIAGDAVIMLEKGEELIPFSDVRAAVFEMIIRAKSER